MPRGTRELSPGRRSIVAYRTITVFGGPFQAPSADRRLMTSRVAPETAPQPQEYFYAWFGLFRVRSPLLTESRLISLPAGTEMFHFPAFASLRLWIQRRMTVHYHGRVAPFGNLRIKARLAAPRSISQLATSFIAYSRQGIHRVPLVA